MKKLLFLPFFIFGLFIAEPAIAGGCGENIINLGMIQKAHHKNFLYDNATAYNSAKKCKSGNSCNVLGGNVYECDGNNYCKGGTVKYMKPGHVFENKVNEQYEYYVCYDDNLGDSWTKARVIDCYDDISGWKKTIAKDNKSVCYERYRIICCESAEKQPCNNDPYGRWHDGTKTCSCGMANGIQYNWDSNQKKCVNSDPNARTEGETTQLNCDGEDVGTEKSVECSYNEETKNEKNAKTCQKVCEKVNGDSARWFYYIDTCKNGYHTDNDKKRCIQNAHVVESTTTTPSTDDIGCSKTELDGLNASEGDRRNGKCVATKCKKGAYLVVQNNQSQGWCVFPTHCNNKPNTTLNIINNGETDLKCVPIEPSEPATSEESAEEEGAETEGDDVSTSDAETSADTSATEQEACAKVGRWAVSTCLCNDIYKKWNRDKLDCEYGPYMQQQTNTECIDAGGTWTMEGNCVCPEGKERKGAYCVGKSGAPGDTQTAGQDPCAVGGGTLGGDGTCKCENGKTWDDKQKKCVAASDAGADAGVTTDEAQSGGNDDGENSASQNGESPEQGVAQEPQVDPAVECSENGGKWDAQSNQCITPEMQREIDRQKSQENVDKLKADADAAREREQSTENKLLGAAGIGATGIGGMMLAQSAAENAADDDAERAMQAYLATFRCDYGGGKTVRGGEQEIELPGGNELINLYSEYIALANDLKVRKEQLGLKPGIESEPILDGATSGLYDDIAVGKTGGAYTSLARALMDPKGADAAAWAAQRAETAKNLKTGAITAGVGAAGSLIANLAINEIGKKDGDGDDAKTSKYTSSLKTVTAGLRPESVQCPPSGGRYPQCKCGGNGVYNPNTNTCDKCTNGFYEWDSRCICDNIHRTESGNMCISDDVVDSNGFVSIDVIKLFKNNGIELTDNAKRAFDKLLDKLKSANVEECDVTINVYTDLVGDASDSEDISDDRYEKIKSYLEGEEDKYGLVLSIDSTTDRGPVGCTCGVGEVPSGQEENIEYSECVGKDDDYVPERFAPCRRVEIKIECDTDDDSISVLMDGLGVVSGSVSRQ